MAENEEVLRVAVDEPAQGRVPRLGFCPSCGTELDGRKCKQVCLNQGCALYRQIIENCAGD